MKLERLPSTSALVILLAEGQIHTGDPARRFLRMLNLDPGRPLYEEFVRLWPRYDQVIKNRKTCVFDLARRAVAEGVEQVVIFGAGFDALSLELHARRNRCRIFEIDIDNMDEKARLLQSVDPAMADHIRCITMDMSDTGAIVPGLVGRGWLPGEPTLVVIEGMSAYLSADALWNAIGKFRTGTGANQIVLEYLVPLDRVSKGRRQMVQRLFDLLASDSGLDEIVRYGAEEIASRVGVLGGTRLRYYDMVEMEMARTSGNVLFKARSDGWSEICSFSI